jgi:signal transduction histidine kinase
VLLVAVGLCTLGGVTLTAHRQHDVRALDAGGYLLLAIAVAVLPLRRRWPVPTLAVTFAATLGYALLNYPGGPIWAPLIIAFGTALVSGHRAAAYISLVLGYGGFVWLVPAVTGGQGSSALIRLGLIAWLALIAAVAELIRNQRAYVRASRQRAAEQQRSRVEQARRQASEERLGIARELHDVVAHSISLINVQAGVALELVDQRPEQARDALAAIKQASKDALVEVQSMLAALRQDGEHAPRTPTRGLAELGTLVSRAETAGLTVRVRTEGAVVRLPAGVDLAAYRIVQEALTNVVRHAGASTATVSLGYGGGVLTVQVDDDGRGGAPGTGGNGLAGMRERADALGGSFAASASAAGGFRVRAVLPFQPDRSP